MNPVAAFASAPAVGAAPSAGHAPAVVPEVLAPAGDWDALKAAVAAGADAVYFGLPHFNARYRATNFSAEELPAVMEYLHARNVRGYVAFNTLVFADELPEAEAALKKAVAAGVDALIVQDLGIVRLAKELCPTLPIHASTQMTLTEPRGIEFARGLGAERAILARELSTADVRKIRERTDLPLEVFVHGAICVAYSGQCLTSEALGGRSANRGQCAQACRMPYALTVDGVPRDLGDRAYLLSPLDLAAVELVPELLDAGICSLKIEGRLKGPAYVAATTRTYRKAVEGALAGTPYRPTRQEWVDLTQAYSRGFSPGFLEGPNHQRLVPALFPKARGVEVGTVVELRGRKVVIAPTDDHPAETFLKPGDGMLFDLGRPETQEPGGRLYGVRELPTRGGERRIELEFGREGADWTDVGPGTRIRRTDDPTLLKRLEAEMTRDVPHRAPLDAELAGELGGPLRLTLRAGGHVGEALWPGPLEVARKHPTPPEMLREQLARLGDTPFELRNLNLRLPAEAMVPKSVLNELRRQAAAEVSALRQAAFVGREIRDGALVRLRLAAGKSLPAAEPVVPGWSVLVRTMEQLQAVLEWRPEAGTAPPDRIDCDFEDVRRYRDAVSACRAAGRAIGLATLRILKPGEEGTLRKIADLAPDVVLIRNLGGLSWFRESAPTQRLGGDFSLNVVNELTADVLLRAGLAFLTPGYDMNWEQLVAMLGRTAPERFEAVVHQHMPMFHMEHCVFAALLSEGKDHRDCGRPCDRHRLDLIDHRGQAFPVHPDVGCRNTVYNSTAQSAAEYIPRMQGLGVRRFRIELLRETPTQLGELLGRYARVLAGRENGRTIWRELQVLNRLGVTRGTMQ